jgi:uncharacterized membrane protein YkoI
MVIRIAVAAMVTLAAGNAVSAAQPSPPISMRQARARAIALVPGGHIREGELEREHGRLVYSFDIVRAHRSGVDEVLIDARTGRVVSHTHETPAMERREARADARHRTRR